MKKALKTLTVTLAAMLCVAVLAACGGGVPADITGYEYAFDSVKVEYAKDATEAQKSAIKTVAVMMSEAGDLPDGVKAVTASSGDGDVLKFFAEVMSGSAKNSPKIKFAENGKCMMDDEEVGTWTQDKANVTMKVDGVEQKVKLSGDKLTVTQEDSGEMAGIVMKMIYKQAV